MWVICEPVWEDDALRAMKRAVPRFARYLESGQIEIIPHSSWYVKNSKFNSRRVLDGRVKKLEGALVSLALRKSGGLIELTVSDNSQGFDPDAERVGYKPHRGIGLSSRRERTELSGETFSIESAPGKGTVIHASWAVAVPAVTPSTGRA